MSYSLFDLQKEFANLLNGDSQSPISSMLVTNSNVDKSEQLNIYQSSMKGSLQKVLKDLYPISHKLVGEEFYIYLMESYIQKTFSTNFDIANYGKDFSIFIENFPHAQSLPYLSNMAKLEWAWHRVFISENVQSKFDFNRLAECYAFQGEKITFSLTPSFLISSPYPIHEIWHANQNDDANSKEIVLTANKEYFLFICRQDLEMRIELLSKNEWQLLSLISEGLSMAKICDRLEEDHKELLTELLPYFVEKGWITDFSF